MQVETTLTIHDRTIDDRKKIFPVLSIMLQDFCRDFSCGSISIVFVKSRQYLFDFIIPGRAETYEEKNFERTILSQVHLDPYTNYTFLETIDLKRHVMRAEAGGTPFIKILEGSWYQIYDDPDYINGLIQQNLLVPNHRDYKMADYKQYVVQEGFRNNYKNFSHFYQKLVVPLRILLDSGDVKLFGYAFLDQFELDRDSALPLEDALIDKIMKRFDEFTLEWSRVVSQFNRKYLPLFKKIHNLEIQLSKFENPAYTLAHSKNVSVLYLYFLKWANASRKLPLSQEDLEAAYLGARFHDIGKVHIPVEILNKVTPLLENDWNIIKEHPHYGMRLLENLEFPSIALDIIQYHHVKSDGSGYPSCDKALHQLVKLFIPLDIFEALVSVRPYKQCFTMEEAFAVLLDLGDQNLLEKKSVDWLIEYITNLVDSGRDFMEKHHILVMDDQQLLFDFIESINRG